MLSLLSHSATTEAASLAGSGRGAGSPSLSGDSEKAGGGVDGVCSFVSSSFTPLQACKSESTISPLLGVGSASLSPVSQMSAATVLNSEGSGDVGPAAIHPKAVEADLPHSFPSDLTVVMTSSESAPARYPPGEEGYEAPLDSSDRPGGDTDTNFTRCPAFSISDQAAKLLFNGTGNSVVTDTPSSCEATASLLPAVISGALPRDEKTAISNEPLLVSPASAHTLLSFSSALLGTRNSEGDVTISSISPEIAASGLHQLTQEEAAAAVAAMAGATGESSETVLAKLASILPFSSASGSASPVAAVQGLASTGEVLSGLRHQDGGGVGFEGANAAALVAAGAGTAQADPAASGAAAPQVRVRAERVSGEAGEPLKSNATAATAASELLLENLVKAEPAEGDTAVSAVAAFKPGGLADSAASTCSARKAAEVAKGRLFSGGGVVDTCGIGGTGSAVMNTAQAASSSFDVFQHCAPSSMAPLDASAAAPVAAPFLSSLSSLDSFKRLCYGPSAPLFDTLSSSSGIDRLSSLSSLSLQALSAAAASSIEGDGSAGSTSAVPTAVATLANQKHPTSAGVTSPSSPRLAIVSPASTAGAAASDFGAGGAEQLRVTERKRIEVTATQGGALAACEEEPTVVGVGSPVCSDTDAKNSSVNPGGSGGDERSTVSTLGATPSVTAALGPVSAGGTGVCGSSATTGEAVADPVPCAADSAGGRGKAVVGTLNSSSPPATDTVDSTLGAGIGRPGTTSMGAGDVALRGAGSDSGGTPPGARAGVTSPTTAAAATAASIGFGMDNMAAALQAEQMRRLLAEFASPDDPYAAAMAVGGLGCPGLGGPAGGTAGAGSSSSSGGVAGTAGAASAGVGDVVVLDDQQRQQQLIIPQEHQLAALTYLQSMEGMTDAVNSSLWMPGILGSRLGATGFFHSLYDFANTALAAAVVAAPSETGSGTSTAGLTSAASPGGEGTALASASVASRSHRGRNGNCGGSRGSRGTTGGGSIATPGVAEALACGPAGLLGAEFAQGTADGVGGDAASAAAAAAAAAWGMYGAIPQAGVIGEGSEASRGVDGVAAAPVKRTRGRPRKRPADGSASVSRASAMVRQEPPDAGAGQAPAALSNQKLGMPEGEVSAAPGSASPDSGAAQRVAQHLLTGGTPAPKRYRRGTNNPDSGFPGVSWNSRMQAWLAFYVDKEGTRRSHTFKCNKFGGIESARVEAIDWLIRKRGELQAESEQQRQQQAQQQVQQLQQQAQQLQNQSPQAQLQAQLQQAQQLQQLQLQSPFATAHTTPDGRLVGLGLSPDQQPDLQLHQLLQEELLLQQQQQLLLQQQAEQHLQQHATALQQHLPAEAQGGTASVLQGALEAALQQGGQGDVLACAIGLGAGTGGGDEKLGCENVSPEHVQQVTALEHAREAHQSHAGGAATALQVLEALHGCRGGKTQQSAGDVFPGGGVPGVDEAGVSGEGIGREPASQQGNAMQRCESDENQGARPASSQGSTQENGTGQGGVAVQRPSVEPSVTAVADTVAASAEEAPADSGGEGCLADTKRSGSRSGDEDGASALGARAGRGTNSKVEDCLSSWSERTVEPDVGGGKAGGQADSVLERHAGELGVAEIPVRKGRGSGISGGVGDLHEASPEVSSITAVTERPKQRTSAEEQEGSVPGFAT